MNSQSEGGVWNKSDHGLGLSVWMQRRLGRGHRGQPHQEICDVCGAGEMDWERKQKNIGSDGGLCGVSKRNSHISQGASTHDDHLYASTGAAGGDSNHCRSVDHSR